MYEVWFTDEGISMVILFGTFDKAVEAAVEMLLAEKVVFEYIVGSEGEIRNDFVVEMASREKKKRKNKKNRDAGKPWVVEVKAQHRIDFWAIADYAKNEDAANAKAADLGIDSDRVRVRELSPEE